MRLEKDARNDCVTTVDVDTARPSGVFINHANLLNVINNKMDLAYKTIVIVKGRLKQVGWPTQLFSGRSLLTLYIYFFLLFADEVIEFFFPLFA